MAGGEYLGFNNSAFLSERANCDRNRALSHFMMGNKCFPLGTDLVKTIELYNQVSMYLCNHFENILNKFFYSFVP